MSPSVGPFLPERRRAFIGRTARPTGCQSNWIWLPVVKSGVRWAAISLSYRAKDVGKDSFIKEKKKRNV